MSVSRPKAGRGAPETRVLEGRESPDLVFFSSVSENTRRFVERLDRRAARIPLRPRVEGMIRVTSPFVLILPTYGGGEQAGVGERKDHHALNAQLNLFAPDGSIQFDKDREAADAYLAQQVAPNTMRFTSVWERLEWLIEHDYYEEGYLRAYDADFVELLHERASDIGHRFQTFLGAFKFFTSYALKTFDGSSYVEGLEERVVATALFLGQGNADLATRLVDEMLSGRFQPATPTFLNAGKAQRGELVSCFLLRLEDNLESIGRSVNSALQLSKRGGGVALLLTNLRETGAPIKQIENQASGVVPVMKILEDSFSYANQLGVVIPNITFELAKQNREMHLFSPYDVLRETGIALSDQSVTDRYEEFVANPRIRKTTINARDFFKTLAELQFESGYP